ncbi:PAS domain S-box protein [Halalkalibaculum sp. DA384]|uniref:PAS domain S-box protein n=1 Tax=Halalkalibaculum sp. DA384 TaxID=3373606 RepID=UPI00375515EA
MENEALLFERHPNPMLLYDMDTLNILKVNHAAVQKYGYSADEFTQLNLEDIRPEEEIERLHHTLEHLNEGLNSSRVFRHKKKDGEIFHVQVTSHAFPYKGYRSRLVSVLDISKEVNARMEVEEAYRELDHLIRENPLAMIKWNSRLEVVEWSKRAEELSGYPGDEMLGKRLSAMDLFSSEVKQKLEQRFREVKGGRPARQLDTRITHRGGTQVDIRIHASVLRDEEGEARMLLTFVEDISQEKQAEQKLSRQNEMIRFVNELSSSVGNLNHYDQALKMAVKKICAFIDWPVGHVYQRANAQRFESTDIWYLKDPDRYQAIVDLSKETDVEPGKGFLGAVINREQPLWLKNLEAHKETFIRQELGKSLPVSTCFAFPVKVQDEITVVLEFFSEHSVEMQPELMEIMATVESQLGRILERIRVREELELSERKYRKLYERANDGILILKGRNIVDCNSKMEELFECSRDEIIGQTPFVFSPAVQPGGSKSDRKGRQYLRKTLNGSPQVFEWKHVTKKGRLIDTEISLNKIVLQDGVYIQAIVRDITRHKQAEQDLKRSEELFRNLFLRAPVAMIMVDRDNQVKMVNRKFEQLFGYTEDELAGEDIDDFIVPEEEAAAAPKMPGQEILGEDFIKEFTRITKNGDPVDVLVGAIPVYLEGEPLAGFGIYIDISDQKNVQRKLQNSLKEKEILLKEIHHRVKNNLAITSALLQLQVLNEENEDVADILGDSLLRIKTMALVHETLYKTENFAHLKLSSYIEKLIGFNNEVTSTADKDIEINLEVEDINLNINQAIPCALVLNEFVTNAFKYAFEGKKRGNLNVRIWEKNCKVHVVVDDNGIGLPDNFEELRRASMGMTLIDQLTDQLEGELHIDSENGTTFELIFEKMSTTGSSSHFLQ